MRCPSFARAALIGAGLAAIAAAAGAPDAGANGRPPATTNVRFRPGDEQEIFLPVTFGLLKSTDDGASFRWVCEATVGYGGTFDPDYAVDGAGDIYATTFEGLRVSRDGGCTFETIGGVLDEEKFVSEVEIGPDGRVWAATSTGGGPNDVYVSADGSEFVSAGLPQEKAWWLSVRTTPADPMRVYVSGFLPDDTTTDPLALLRRSIDGGQTWEELPVDQFAFIDRRDLYLVGVSPTDADVLFARVVGAVEPAGDALYRSGDGGLNWTRVAEFGDAISSFLIRTDGQTVIAASTNGCPGDAEPDLKGCVRISHDGGVEWQLAAEQPRLACLGERSDGTLFGCGANWEPDNFALGSSTDGETWDKVFRFSETTGPLDCPAETQQAECAALTWPTLCVMFGICDDLDASVGGPDAGEPSDGGDGGGCCRVGGGTTDASWVPGLLVVLFGLVWRSRARARDRIRSRK
ncbi:MAG TPA: hypothetical protein VK698_25550 [Kofleriaceae bacterium]|nr:hypothetical protein [Kofleriaceae bacterium]